VQNTILKKNAKQNDKLAEQHAGSVVTVQFFLNLFHSPRNLFLKFVLCPIACALCALQDRDIVAIDAKGPDFSHCKLGEAKGLSGSQPPELIGFLKVL
jgi:hypothetical protein